MMSIVSLTTLLQRGAPPLALALMALTVGCGGESPDPLPPPGPDTGNFYAVGDGASDGSSDFFKFAYDAQSRTITSYTKIGETGGEMVDVAVDSTSGRIYSVDWSGRLYQLSAISGSATPIGSAVAGINALDFCNGTLYGWGGSYLYRINTLNGVASQLSNVGFSPSGDLGCSNGGQLYGIADEISSDVLVRINLNGSSGTRVGTLGQNNVYGFDMNGSDEMYAANASRDTLYLFKVDPQTGIATQAASYPTNAGLNGLALAP